MLGLKIKHFLETAWLWIKNNLLLLVVLFGVLYMFIAVKRRNKTELDLWEKFKNQLESNNKSMDELKKIQNEQFETQQQINKKYAEIIQELEFKHSEQLKLLTSKKEKELKEIIAVNKDNPELMAVAVNKLFGIKIYEASNSNSN